MMDKYTRSIYSILLRYGSSSEYTLRKVVEGDYIDPSQPSMGRETTTTDYDILAYKGAHDFKTVDGSTIQVGDFPLYVSAYDLDTDLDESYLILDSSSNKYNIISYKKYNVSEDTMFYVLNIRN